MREGICRSLRGLRASWCRKHARTAKCQRIGRAELNDRGGSRKWYAGWGQKDWGPLDSLLADDFTFSSAAGDDHISKSAFKKQCWETQINFIGHFDLERVATGPDDAL